MKKIIKGLLFATGVLLWGGASYLPAQTITVTFTNLPANEQYEPQSWTNYWASNSNINVMVTSRFMPNGVLDFNLGLDGNGAPQLYNNGGCCSTPYLFTFSTNVYLKSVDVSGFYGPTQTFSNSAGTVITITNTGPVDLTASERQQITSFSWNSAGPGSGMAIDNLVYVVPSTANSWTNGSDKWENAGDWSLSVIPALNQAVFVTNSVTKTLTIDGTTSSDWPNSMTVNLLTLSAPSGYVSTLSLTNAGTSLPLNILDPTGLVLGSNSILTVTNSAVVLDPHRNDGFSIVSPTGSFPDGLTVGDLGTFNNALTIGSGAQVNTQTGVIGLECTICGGDTCTMCPSGLTLMQPCANGNSVTVIGVWNNATYLDVGYAGGGNRLIVTNGGVINTTNLYLGVLCTSSGNQVTINQGAVNSQTGYVGYVDGGTDLGTVNGGGSTWSNQAVLYVGYASSGNQISVSSTGQIVNGSTLYVGYGGSNNKLFISSAGEVVNGFCTLGWGADANFNMATVTGSGSVWSNTGDLVIGDVGLFNDLIVTNGGFVQNDNATVGYDWDGGGNEAVVVGTNSTWSNLGTLTIGYAAADNDLYIGNGGVVSCSNLVMGTVQPASEENVLFIQQGPFTVGGLPNGPGFYGASSATINDSSQVIATNGATYVGYDRTGQPGG